MYPNSICFGRKVVPIRRILCQSMITTSGYVVRVRVLGVWGPAVSGLSLRPLEFRDELSGCRAKPTISPKA